MGHLPFKDVYTPVSLMPTPHIVADCPCLDSVFSLGMMYYKYFADYMLSHESLCVILRIYFSSLLLAL